MGMPEVYVALQTGTIDGQENPPTIFNAAKFHEVSKQMVLTSHLVQPIFYAVAKPYFDKLKPEQQKKLREAAVRGAKWNDDNRLADEKTRDRRPRRQGPHRVAARPRRRSAPTPTRSTPAPKRPRPGTAS